MQDRLGMGQKHRTKLHCTVLHSTTPNSTALHSTTPNSTALHCTAQQCTVLTPISKQLYLRQWTYTVSKASSLPTLLYRWTVLPTRLYSPTHSNHSFCLVPSAFCPLPCAMCLVPCALYLVPCAFCLLTFIVSINPYMCRFSL